MLSMREGIDRGGLVRRRTSGREAGRGINGWARRTSLPFRFGGGAAKNRYLPAFFFVTLSLWLNLEISAIAFSQGESGGNEAAVANDTERVESAASDGDGNESLLAPRKRRAPRTIGELSTTLDPTDRSDTVRTATTSSESFFARYLRTLGVLVLVVGGTVVLATYIRRRMRAPRRADGGRFVEVLSRTMITSKQQVILLRVGERALLLGVSPERFDKLIEFEEPQEIIALSGQAMSRSGKFADVLEGVGERLRRGSLGVLHCGDRRGASWRRL